MDECGLVIVRRNAAWIVWIIDTDALTGTTKKEIAGTLRAGTIG